MMSRTNRATILGLVVFAVGATATFAVLRGEKDTGVMAGRGPNAAIVAVKDIAAGTTGADAVRQNLVAMREVPTRARPANALTDVMQLSRTITLSLVPAGRVLTPAEFPPSQTRIGTLRIPPNMTAIAVQMANVSGVAGFAGAGDKIDIYGVARTANGARLIMQSIEVLSVNGTTLAPSAGQPGGAGLVFLLAATPAQAERLVYFASFEQLYFSLVAKDQAPFPPPPGVGPGDALKPL